jgi:hypothetical protein
MRNEHAPKTARSLNAISQQLRAARRISRCANQHHVLKNPNKYDARIYQVQKENVAAVQFKPMPPPGSRPCIAGKN